VRIPNVSPGFDADWEKNGNAEKAVNLLAKWIESQKLNGCTLKILKEPKRTHMILAVIEATAGVKDPKTVLFYAHCDKQPPLAEQWKPGLKPYDPVIQGSKMFGRGASDDGYGTYAIIMCIKACQMMGRPHDRCVVIIESCEESGSADLGYYLETIKDIVKIPSLMVIMDSGCGDYERLWLTTTLRGNLSIDLKRRLNRM
jgi:acetylornithine deacetylase/succinyl-diaminopimelate desuccinylase-like protein